MQVLRSTDGFFASIVKSLADIDPDWMKYNGLLLTGTHAPESVDVPKALNFIKQARESKMPTLGICFGLEMAVVEFARNVLNIPEATSEELDPNAAVKVIDKLPGMRCGIFPVRDALENHWHRYKVSENARKALVPYFRITMTGEIVEELELVGHPFYFLTQYHPEYNSTPGTPHPVLKAFLDACKKAT